MSIAVPVAEECENKGIPTIMQCTKKNNDIIMIQKVVLVSQISNDKILCDNDISAK